MCSRRCMCLCVCFAISQFMCLLCVCFATSVTLCHDLIQSAFEKNGFTWPSIPFQSHGWVWQIPIWCPPLVLLPLCTLSCRARGGDSVKCAMRHFEHFMAFVLFGSLILFAKYWALGLTDQCHVYILLLSWGGDFLEGFLQPTKAPSMN
jgi:hypothetical protein